MDQQCDFGVLLLLMSVSYCDIFFSIYQEMSNFNITMCMFFPLLPLHAGIRVRNFSRIVLMQTGPGRNYTHRGRGPKSRCMSSIIQLLVYIYFSFMYCLTYLHLEPCLVCGVCIVSLCPSLSCTKML